MDLSVCNKDIVIKQSDFSIDHILHRAGEVSRNSETNCNKYENSNSLVDNCSLPMFSWLQYTRYRPPKLPRPLKVGPTKRTPGRLPRVPFTVNQLAALEDAYKQSSYLSSEVANRLAMNLDLTSTRVKIWFQNRRARERREKREDLVSNEDSTNKALEICDNFKNTKHHIANNCIYLSGNSLNMKFYDNL